MEFLNYIVSNTTMLPKYFEVGKTIQKIIIQDKIKVKVTP